MDYFHTDDALTRQYLADAFSRAARDGLPVRIQANKNYVKVKVGQGIWSPPLKGTFDAYRDGQ